METRTKQRTQRTHGRFFKALRGMQGATKEDIVFSYSGQKTTSLSEFFAQSPRTYWVMVYDLERKIQNTVLELQVDKIVKQKRSAILKRLQKHGVDTTDWRKVNAFLEQPRIAGKRLYDMTIDEMQDLIKKLESILTKDNVKMENIKRITQLN